ncbi:MAG TPA: sigma-70 family RNA polymerase sigma factor [Blastocatellia bacterium]|nr:sigma-70 family RNA polymerase sigma factor [Blastocatellia bacterium]
MTDSTAAEIKFDDRNLDGLTDEELVDCFVACQKTERERAQHCFEVIVARYRGLINHVARYSQYRYPEWDAADDVVSRAIYKLYRGLRLWRREGKLSSFIARITQSEMIDTIRRVRRDKSWTPRPAADPDDDEPSEVERAPAHTLSPEAEAIRNEQREIVDQLLGDVCRDWKDSVIVSDYIILGRNATEISAEFGMSEDLVYQRAHRLKERLRKWLEAHGFTSANAVLGGAKKKKQ